MHREDSNCSRIVLAFYLLQKRVSSFLALIVNGDALQDTTVYQNKYPKKMKGDGSRLFWPAFPTKWSPGQADSCQLQCEMPCGRRA